MTMGGSRLVLGTAQLDGGYGIANTTGVADADRARALVVAAIEGGITTFDTAAGYGNSEVLLGKAIADLGVADRVSVVTKVIPLADAAPNPSAQSARATIRASVHRSLDRLRLDRLDAVLFHREEDARWLDALAELRDEGVVARVGVSLGNEPGAAPGLGEAGVDALQVPVNVFDPRHVTGGTLEAAERSGVTVFVRSVYLQGLLLMPESSVPGPLRGLIPARRALGELARREGMTMAELGVRYAWSQPGDVRVIVGAETPEQVRANAALLTGEGLAASTVTDIDDAVGELAPELITPCLWSAVHA